MILIWVGVLHKLYVSLLQGPGEEHRVLVVDIVVRHAMVQHPRLVPQVLNPLTNQF